MKLKILSREYKKLHNLPLACSPSFISYFLPTYGLIAPKWVSIPGCHFLLPFISEKSFSGRSLCVFLPLHFFFPAFFFFFFCCLAASNSLILSSEQKEKNNGAHRKMLKNPANRTFCIRISSVQSLSRVQLFATP